MHTLPVLHKFFRSAFPQVHAMRLAALTSAVDAVAQGASVSITAMGRGLNGGGRIKHRIKRMNRLVGNRRLFDERERFYCAMLTRLLAGTSQPVILVDWSEFNADGSQQLLRASLPVGGRALTLYEELHPQALLGNRSVQHHFLDRLAAMLPADCLPIVIADAGFRVPFFRYVEKLGWHWLGRIRGRDMLRWEGAPYEWVGAKSLHTLASARARELGTAQWVRSNPLVGRLVLIRHRGKGRTDYSRKGITRQSRHSRKNAKRNVEPWLLIASPSLQAHSAKRIVRLYKTRMQCEENFRDTKSAAYGLGIAKRRCTSLERASNLLLIAALAAFALWLIGCLARAQGWERTVRANSSSRTASYSTLFLARLVIKHVHERLSVGCFDEAGRLAENYLSTVTKT